MNDTNKMLERVLLMMKYDSSKTLKENSDVVKHEFAQQLNEAVRVGSPKPTGGKKANTAKGNKVVNQPTGGYGLKGAQLKQVNDYRITPKRNGKLPTERQVDAFAAKLAGVKPGNINVSAPPNSIVKVYPSRVRSKKPTPKDQSILSRISNNIKNNKGRWAIGLIAGAGLTAAGIYLYLQFFDQDRN